MSKKKSWKQKPRLSGTQVESSATLSPEERAGRRAEMEAAVAEARRRQGLSALREGTRLLFAGQFDEAIVRLERAVNRLPDSADAAMNLGGAYIQAGQFNKAVFVLQKAGELAPDNAMVWVNLAAAYLGHLELAGPKQQRQAIAAYERALALDPAAPSVHYNLGLIYKDQQDWAQARAYFRQAQALNPDDQDAGYWLKRLDELEER